MIVADATASDDEGYAARMTNAQFSALRCRLTAKAVLTELKQLACVAKITKGKRCDVSTVSRWLVNGWNTEFLMRINANALKNDALRHSLHWAFPQAYYSVFAVTQAYFKSVGFTEDSHTSTIRKVGSEMASGKYPASLSFLAIGAPPFSFAGLDAGANSTSLHLDIADPHSVDAQITQFLRATRKIDLKQKKPDLKFKTRQGAPKKSLTLREWGLVADKLGPTCVLSLLYRKRIKANYRDIDSLLHPELDAPSLHADLTGVVAAINYVHEAFVLKALGPRAFAAAIDALPAAARREPERRYKALQAE